jgi:hypothetical protein
MPVQWYSLVKMPGSGIALRAVIETSLSMVNDAKLKVSLLTATREHLQDVIGIEQSQAAQREDDEIINALHNVPPLGPRTPRVLSSARGLISLVDQREWTQAPIATNIFDAFEKRGRMARSSEDSYGSAK